jgi:predicted nucleic acid-binding protein
MTAFVLDAGALIAVDRGDHAMHDKIQAALRKGTPVRTNPNAVAQVWRNGAKQSRLARLLRDVEIEPITREDGYRAGELLGVTRTKDVVDATVALLAKTGDRLYTSDPNDLGTLCAARGFKPVVIAC